MKLHQRVYGKTHAWGFIEGRAIQTTASCRPVPALHDFIHCPLQKDKIDTLLQIKGGQSHVMEHASEVGNVETEGGGDHASGLVFRQTVHDTHRSK